MSRSIFGTICIEPLGSMIDKTDRVMNEKGFTQVFYDYEYVWIKENSETNLVTYIKLEYIMNILVCSAWLKEKGDDSCREVRVEAYRQNSAETKDAEDVVKSLLNLFEGKFKKIECYTYINESKPFV